MDSTETVLESRPLGNAVDLEKIAEIADHYLRHHDLMTGEDVAYKILSLMEKTEPVAEVPCCAGLCDKFSFNNDAEIFQWLLSGGKITPKNIKSDNGFIYLQNGNKTYENGKDAKECLMSFDYWKRLIA